MYTKGQVYVWQNLTGKWSYLNGKETTVTGDMVVREDHARRERLQTWETDTPHPNPESNPKCVVAYPGELKPKGASTGEQSILELFKKNQHEKAEA